MVPIWSLMWLLAMAPTEDSPQVGEDAPHLDRSLAGQTASNATPQARAFRDRWGPLHVRWDERNGTPRALVGTGLPPSDAPALVADLARLGGVGPATLVFEGAHDHPDGETWTWTQHHRGAPIEGGGVVVHVRHGRISLVLARLHRPKLATDPGPGEVLLADHHARPLSYAWVTRETAGDEVHYRARTGEVVHRWTSRMHLDLEVEERTVGDDLLTVPAREVQVTDSDGTVETTGDDGAHGLSGTLDVRLEGPNLLVREHETPIAVSGIDDALLTWDVDLFPSALSVQHHFHIAWDWLADRRPSHTWLDRQVTASVLLPGSCNAYYTNGTINFYEEGNGCEDFGRIADVIYHELGHGFHHYVIREGTFAGDVSEGSSDFVSATLLDDPILAPESLGPGTYIRELETDMVYPDDANGKVHNDGLIWASLLWNLRTDWIDTYGYETGTRMVDELFLETLSYGPTLTDMTEAVISADDDNGDLSDGTPHDCELIDRLNAHGIGPGAMGLVVLDHEPLGPQGSDTDGYELTFTLAQAGTDCGALDPDSARVVYGTDLEGAFDPVTLTELVPTRDGETYTAVIPRQLPGTLVSYGMQWSSADGTATAVSHDDRRDGLHDFWVGDREAVWCAGFEHGWDGVETTNRVYGERPDDDWIDEWERDAPLGQDWNPTGAWTGSQVIGTDLTDDGLYTRHNGQRAQTADLRLNDLDPRFALLSARRWLTVEDGKYDQAQVWADLDSGRETLWSNPSTDGGSRHVLDQEWTVFDVDVRSLLDRGEDVRFAFTLNADGGLEYGGWALDDLCLVTLADVPGHYRVQDLVATDDADVVTVSWTQPFIAPLATTVLVRKREGFPEHPDDGLIVDIDLAPEIGGSKVVTDLEVAPGETYHYAVFAAEVDQDYHPEVVPGENADAGGVPLPEPIDTGGDSGTEDTGDSETEETGTPPVDGDPPTSVPEGEDAGCSGCAAGPTAPGPWWLLLALAWGRRRRP